MNNYKIANKLDNLTEMNKFLGTYNLSRLNREKIENLNRPIISNKIQSVVKRKSPSMCNSTF